MIFAFAFLILASGCLSFVHPWGNQHSESATVPILSGSEVPNEVRRILDRKCADCHSNSTHWPIYSRLAPASWLVERDVSTGRFALNLSLWPAMSPDDRIDALARIVAEVRSGEMPPKPYALVHGIALTESDKQMIASWSRAERKRIRAKASEPMEKK